MTWVIVGLGNPGEEYDNTRHNAGRMMVQHFVKTKSFDIWKEDKAAKALVTRGTLERALVICILPNTFMNKSGFSLTRFVKSVKSAERLIVVYDDLDLPLGALKVSFDRGSGGHKGLDSIMKTLKTRRFVRVRIGISPENAKGELKKPQGEKQVEKFILNMFGQTEYAALKKVFASATDAVHTIITKDYVQAMNAFN